MVLTFSINLSPVQRGQPKCMLHTGLWGNRFEDQLRRAAARGVLVHRLSSDLHGRWPRIVHWLTCHPAKRRGSNMSMSFEKGCVAQENNNKETIFDKLICGLIPLPVLDFGCHRHESLLHISSIFCTGLHKGDANFIRKCLFTSQRQAT